MIHVSLSTAQTDLPELARRVERGETIVVTRDGEPVLDLSPHRRRTGLRLEAIEDFKRRHGLASIFPVITGDFDDPLPEDILLQPLPPGS
jgi:prevent-host-death family protein